MHTDVPSSVSTSAEVAPPGPEPTTTTSKSGTGHLVVAPAPRLHVARIADRAPTDEVSVPSVLGCAVARLTGVLEHERAELALFVECRTLRAFVADEEVVAERGDAVAVRLLPPAHRAVPLTFGEPARALDPRAPGELLDARQREELGEAGFPSRATRVRATGPDPGRVERERAE